jgi:hypothetical protein
MQFAAKILNFFFSQTQMLGFGSGSAWIRIVFGSWIRIRIRVKSWIRIHINIKIQELLRLKMKPWRAVDAQNGGLEGL